MPRQLALAPAALLALALSVGNVEAQRPVQFGIAAGATIPTGDLGDEEEGLAKTGFHVLLTADVGFATLPFGVRFDGAWHQLGMEGLDNDYRILSLSGNAKLGFMAGLVAKPYVIGGIGLHRWEITDEEELFGEEIDAETDFGFNIGAGMEFVLAGFGTFGEIRYTKVLVEDGDFSYIPLTFGIKF